MEKDPEPGGFGQIVGPVGGFPLPQVSQEWDWGIEKEKNWENEKEGRGNRKGEKKERKSGKGEEGEKGNLKRGKEK